MSKLLNLDCSNLLEMLTSEDPSSIDEFSFWEKNSRSLELRPDEAENIVKLILSVEDPSDFIYLLLDAVSESNSFPNGIPSLAELFNKNDVHPAVDQIFDAAYFEGFKNDGISPLYSPNEYLEKLNSASIDFVLEKRILSYLENNNHFNDLMKEKITVDNLLRLEDLIG